MHVKKIQERHFLEIEKSNVKNHPGFGGEGLGVLGGGHWGIYGGGGELEYGGGIKYIYIYILIYIYIYIYI